jgi:hypothetical protein
MEWLRRLAETDPQAAAAMAADPAMAAKMQAAEAAVPEPAWEWVWRAWHRLNADRPWLGGGMGPMLPGRIAWRDLLSWCDQNGGDLDFLDACCFALDTEFIDWHRKRLPKA